MTLYVSDPATGYNVTKNITAKTELKGAPGLIAKIAIIVAGATVGTVNDMLFATTAAVGNQIAAIPVAATGGAAGDVIELQLPFFIGLTITPGTDGVVVVSWS